jgi:hypothetical protein
MDRLAPADVGSGHLGIGQHLVRQAARQFLAIVQHQHLVGEVANELHVVLDPDHGRRELVPDAQEVARQILLLLPIELLATPVEMARYWVGGSSSWVVPPRHGRAERRTSTARDHYDRPLLP